MNHNLLALGIGFAELIILLIIGGGLLIAGVIALVAILSSSKKSRPPVLPSKPSSEQRLDELNALHAKKLITEAEYQERRAAILKDL